MGREADYLDVTKCRLDGKVVVITGASAGIGKETARNLARRGPIVVMGNRNLEKSETVRQQILMENPEIEKEKFIVKKSDLTSLKSVRNFAEEVKKDYPKIDVLINNAGMIFDTRQVTEDGYEYTFQVNHLGHFLLTYLLIDNILAAENPKILNISSDAHRSSTKLNFDEMSTEKNFSSFPTYCRSKLMNILFSKCLAEKYAGKINVYSVHPGVVRTEFGRDIGVISFFYKYLGCCMKSERSGAFTSIYCVTSEKAANETGLYYKNSKATQPTANAKDAEQAKRLWEESCKLANIEWNF